MCTDKKKAVLGDFRAKMGEYLRLQWNCNIRNKKIKKCKLSIADGLP